MAMDMEARLNSLRSCMLNSKYVGEPLTAYVIPTEDSHQSEYIAECDKRREFLSGFTGSAGTAVVTADSALLWTDGRYHLQASQQLPPFWTLMKIGVPGVPSIEEWLSKELPAGSRVGFDPSLTSALSYNAFQEALEGTGVHLVSVHTNLVDVVWNGDRPPRPCNQLLIQSVKYSGRSWQEKVADVREKMKSEGATVVMVSALDEIAWLFNLRGSDVEFNPVFFAYAILTMNDIRLYMRSEQLSSEVREHLAVDRGGVMVFDYSEVSAQLGQLVGQDDTRVWIGQQASLALYSLVPVNKRRDKLSPIQLLKAIKNETEIEGMRNSHIRDAAAVCEYFQWLDEQVEKLDLNEVTAADKLEELRREQPDYVSLSFPTISSSGPNGAVIHYRPLPPTARRVSRQELYLCDSGGQYRDGTTDITRTISLGQPTQKQKECFTLVLKGHIALCTCVFPNKTMGSRLDSLARQFLWLEGLDYRHGTGHGVGAFLNVHEGPQSVGTRAGKNPRYAEPLQQGMFISDEPGYYEDGEFGIRIENVVLIVPCDTRFGKDFLTMEPFTLVPIQLKMIEPSMLTGAEISWLNEYHSECLEKVGSYLRDNGKTKVLQWLEKETQLLG